MFKYKTIKQINHDDDESSSDDCYQSEKKGLDILEKFEEIRELIENKDLNKFLPLELYSLGNELLDDIYKNETIIIPQLYLEMIFQYIKNEEDFKSFNYFSFILSSLVSNDSYYFSIIKELNILEYIQNFLVSSNLTEETPTNYLFRLIFDFFESENNELISFALSLFPLDLFIMIFNKNNNFSPTEDYFKCINCFFAHYNSEIISSEDINNVITILKQFLSKNIELFNKDKDNSKELISKEENIIQQQMQFNQSNWKSIIQCFCIFDELSSLKILNNDNCCALNEEIVFYFEQGIENSDLIDLLATIIGKISIQASVFILVPIQLILQILDPKTAIRYDGDALISILWMVDMLLQSYDFMNSFIENDFLSFLISLYGKSVFLFRQRIMLIYTTLLCNINEENIDYILSSKIFESFPEFINIDSPKLCVICINSLAKFINKLNIDKKKELFDLIADEVNPDVIEDIEDIENGGEEFQQSIALIKETFNFIADS